MIFCSRRDFIRSTGSALVALPLLQGCSFDQTALSLQSPWINDAEFLGYFIAQNDNIFINHSVNFKYLSGGPDKIADQVLYAGKSDLALTNPETTVALIVNEGAPLKIIGTQYHKSPLGIVSLEKNNINKPSDLIGKRLAVPAANRITIAAFLKANSITVDQLQVVPYAYDPSILINGQCDATVDFVTNVPFVIEMAGHKTTSFLLYDHGLKLFMDTVVVRADVLARRRKEIVGFLRAARRGWEVSFDEDDAKRYIISFMNSYFKGTGRSAENEIAFHKNQIPYIRNNQGVFAMSSDAISSCVESLNAIGLRATREMFDTSVLAEL